MRKFNPDKEETHLWEGNKEITIRLREGVTYYGLGDLLSHEDRYAIMRDGNNLQSEDQAVADHEGITIAELRKRQMDPKPLQPLPYGKVVIVGAKASNFDKDILEHPRVELWNSQEEHWTDKDLPVNTRAVFFTKWVGRGTWNRVMADARKRNITVFNHEGTGIIARQVRELLDITKLKAQPLPEFPPVEELPMKEVAVTNMFQDMNVYKEREMNEMTPVAKSKTGGKVVAKLYRLHEFIDWEKSNTENADFMLKKAKELGISTTRASLAEHVGKIRRAQGKTPVKAGGYHAPIAKSDDISVPLEILNNAISALKDVKEYLIATEHENTKLKGKLDKFRKFFED